MREILFKAKRIDNGEWVEGYYVQKGDNLHYIYTGKTISHDYIQSTSECIEVDEHTICQYTGLTDKNGNKIWENDIVCVCDIDHAIAIYSEKHSGYILQPIEDYYFDSPMLADNMDIINKVIGNIFDNPELMEAGGKHE